MKLYEIRQLTEAVSCGTANSWDTEIYSAYAGDLMSDVLAKAGGQDLLITGLINPQTVHTAQIMEISAILFVGGKPVDEVTIQLASKYQITVLITSKGMFEVCALLYQNGVRP